MLLFFIAAAVLAYLSLCRLASNRWIALTATLLAFSSYYLLYYNDMTANEGMPDLFAVMLTFHGMIIFVQEGALPPAARQDVHRAADGMARLGSAAAVRHHSGLRAISYGRVLPLQLLPPPPPPPPRYVKLNTPRPQCFAAATSCLASLRWRSAWPSSPSTSPWSTLPSDGETPLTELPSVFQSMLKRTGDLGLEHKAPIPILWSPFLKEQFRIVFRMFIPYCLIARPDRRDSAF